MPHGPIFVDFFFSFRWLKSEFKGMFHDLLALLKEHVYFSITSITTSNVSLVGENP
jgi:hypothetical protein